MNYMLVFLTSETDQHVRNSSLTHTVKDNVRIQGACFQNADECFIVWISNEVVVDAAFAQEFL